jgi:RimJ/RimL family protein N-acetyltransferase
MPLPRIAPVWLTRTTVRELLEQDLPDLYEVNADPQVTRFLPYATWESASDAAAWFDRMAALAASGSGRQLVIVMNADAKVIGTALLFKYDEGSHRLELGYVLGRRYWGQGYADEALRGLLGHIFGVVGIRRVEAEVNPANGASHAVLRRLGFTQEGLLRERWTAKGQTYSTHIYGLLAAEWRQERA